MVRPHHNIRLAVQSPQRLRVKTLNGDDFHGNRTSRLIVQAFANGSKCPATHNDVAKNREPLQEGSCCGLSIGEFRRLPSSSFLALFLDCCCGCFSLYNRGPCRR
jgi:hypothetical protein